MSACVTLDEVIAAAQARCASLVPETSGYLALAVSDATSRLPLRLDDRAVLLTTEGTVTVRTRGEPVAPAEAARLLRDLLARLLAASAGSMPNLAATARPRPASEQDPDAVARELEAALIPVNRNAARRALARLARETLRAKEAGRLRRARAGAQARPAAPEASAPAAPEASAPAAPEASAPAAPEASAPAAAAPAVGDEVAVAQRDQGAVAPRAPAIVELTLSPGPVAPAVVELTLSPGLVTCETAGPTVPAPAIAGDIAVTADAAGVGEASPEIAPEPDHATHVEAPVEAVPEPTPTVVQAVVDVEAAAVQAEIPAIPELIEPVRSIAPVAPIAPVATPAPAVATASAAGERAAPSSSAAARDAASCREAFTSPEGIEVFLVELSPSPASVVAPPAEPTPTQSILVEFSPDPGGVAPLSQEPTPTVATAVWAEMAAAEDAAATSAVDALAATAEAPAVVIEAPAVVVEAPAATAEAPAVVVEAPAVVVEAPAVVVEAPAATAEAPAVVVEALAATAEAPAVVVEALAATAEAPAVVVEALAATAEAPAVVVEAPAVVAEAAATTADDADALAADDAPAAAGAPADAVETARAPAIQVLLEAAPALQVTPAYGGWPLVERGDVAAASAPRRASVAPPEETPAARHTLPWPLPAQRGDGAPAPAAVTAAPAPADAAPPQAPAAPSAAPADAPPADAAPVEEPCPAGLDTVDAIVWSASRRSRSARPPADGAGPSRVDELVARFAAQSEHSAQRRAARSMKALAGLDLTLTPPPVAALSAIPARAAASARSPLSAATPPVPSEDASPGAALAALDVDSRPPAPVVAPRRRGLSLWLALVALALLCAVLVGTLRPELFASLAEPLARGALHAVPRAEARTPPPHD
ncbi:hypothetical protein [Sorangium sp. So ce854]|uniref:hypothetical protein n=1 Tax=Sorangium sp. So ce854 TaxID=3133322 RepID=UPI003F60956D